MFEWKSWVRGAACAAVVTVLFMAIACLAHPGARPCAPCARRCTGAPPTCQPHSHAPRCGTVPAQACQTTRRPPAGDPSLRAACWAVAACLAALTAMAGLAAGRAARAPKGGSVGPSQSWAALMAREERRVHSHIKSPGAKGRNGGHAHHKRHAKPSRPRPRRRGR